MFIRGAATWTVGTAAWLGTLPTELVATARYCPPLLARVAPTTLNRGLVAPVMSPQVPPLSVLNCHCKVGAGAPLAATANCASCPAVMVTLAGWVVKAGATAAALTVSVAALL